MILSHVGSVFSTSCILCRAPRTKETLLDFSLSWVPERGHDWGHLISKQGTKDNNISYYLIFFTSFLTGQLCLFSLFP